MGWVEDEFQERSDYEQFVPQLWNAMRDSIGVAVTEFNKHTSDAATNHLTAGDCTAMGKYCRRVAKRFGSVSVEIFLEEKEKALKTSTDPAQPANPICGYRIKADRSGAEFFENRTEGSVGISTEDACRRALKQFIFP